MAAPSMTPGPGEDVGSLLDEAAELLPQQAPLHAFVHHNTLHHFEHLPFDEAVVEAGRILGAEPYQSEQAFAEHLASGRIQPRDVDLVLSREPLPDDAPLFEGGPTPRAFREFRLANLFEVPNEPSVAWLLYEGQAITRFDSRVSAERERDLLALGDPAEVLGRLWSSLERAAPLIEEPPVGPRWRDRLYSAFGRDADHDVHPLLIRLCASFLDQGISYWSMPGRELGLLRAVRRLYGLPLAPPTRFTGRLARNLRRQEEQDWSAEQTIEWALDEGGVAYEDRAAFIRDTLLSLRGWAGMVRHLELRPDRAPVEAPPARLADYLALQLVFDLIAAQEIARDEGVTLDRVPVPRSEPAPDRCRVYEAFVLAQRSDIPLQRFDDESVARAWLGAVADLDAIERRRIMHLAYERRHRVEVLDAILAGLGRPRRDRGARSFQAVFCIDDREESTRRHLEEVDPDVETFGYAGFFGVAMAYQGLDDVKPRPLCPVVIDPVHLVREVPASDPGERYVRTRRQRALAQNASVVGTRTLVRGGLISSLLGPLSIVPLVGRALFPSLAHRVSHWVEGFGVARPTTRLALENPSQADADVEGAIREGYREDEMVAIVESALRTMGLDPAVSPLVLIVGHGSSSLNNPHEAAHDCGATGGGRGGPNARAFAAMANHAGVRTRLAERGLVIPDETIFVGAYHNTCDDSLVVYDEDLVPETHAEHLSYARARMLEACRREAHERARRFDTSPLDAGVDEAFEDAREHSIDLAQPRPEYGHATNAICLVGRRELTRGLFLDRRAFLVSYDPTLDTGGELLGPLMESVGPVGAGINLEYYFSFVDPTGYGSGTKLPHNITGLLGVMNGHATDLRTGLPWQMVEIHEPVRLLTIVDASPALLSRLLDASPGLSTLVRNAWIQLVAQDPETGELSIFRDGSFHAHVPDEVGEGVPEAEDSRAYYGGHREHLAPAWLRQPETV